MSNYSYSQFRSLKVCYVDFLRVSLDIPDLQLLLYGGNNRQSKIYTALFISVVNFVLSIKLLIAFLSR